VTHELKLRTSTIAATQGEFAQREVLVVAVGRCGTVQMAATFAAFLLTEAAIFPFTIILLAPRFLTGATQDPLTQQVGSQHPFMPLSIAIELAGCRFSVCA